jgi:hypothetical protein
MYACSHVSGRKRVDMTSHNTSHEPIHPSLHVNMLDTCWTPVGIFGIHVFVTLTGPCFSCSRNTSFRISWLLMIVSCNQRRPRTQKEREREMGRERVECDVSDSDSISDID